MKRCGLLLVFVFSILVSYSQFKNIRLDERSEGNLACEPAIAINPRNPQNIVAASVKDNIYYTFDGGKTWEKRKVTSPYGVYGDPVVIADLKGTFYYFHLADPTGEGWRNEKSLDAIICHVSDDGGKTWDAGNPVGLNSPKDQDKPWADVNSKGEIVLAWTQFDKYKSEDADCKSTIMLSTSSNGRKWSKPIEISNTRGNCADDANTTAGASPAISDDKKQFVIWAHNGKLMLDRSFDNGYMWLSNDIEVTTQNGGWAMTVPGHDRTNGLPTIRIDRTRTSQKGLMYVVYAEIPKGRQDSDVYVLRSNQFGDYWTAPLQIGEDVNQRHQYMPAMCIDQVSGYVYILYYDRSAYDDNKTDVVLAWSSNNGASFKTVVISESPFTPDEQSFFGDYLGISAHKGVIAPVWTRMDEGRTSVMTTVIRYEQLPQ